MSAAGGVPVPGVDRAPLARFERASWRFAAAVTVPYWVTGDDHRTATVPGVATWTVTAPLDRALVRRLHHTGPMIAPWSSVELTKRRRPAERGLPRSARNHPTRRRIGPHRHRR